MNEFQQFGNWESEIEAGRLLEVPAAICADRIQYRTALSTAAWRACMAGASAAEQVRRLDDILVKLAFRLDVEPAETEIEFSIYFPLPPGSVRLSSFVTLNSDGHPVVTIRLSSRP